MKGQGQVAQQISVDNGPEFLSNVCRKWAQDNTVTIHYIQPGKSVQNSFVERLNRICREKLLSPYIFNTMEQVELKATREYNHYRPYQALDTETPVAYAFLKKYNVAIT